MELQPGTKRGLRILYLEDNPLYVDLVRRELQKGDFEFELKNVDTRDAFIEALQQFKPDVVLSDYCLPSFDSREALEIAKRQHPNTPFILLSGTLGEERAIEVMKNGVTDYIVK